MRNLGGFPISNISIHSYSKNEIKTAILATLVFVRILLMNVTTYQQEPPVCLRHLRKIPLRLRINLSLLRRISFIVAGVVLTGASLIVEAGQIAPNPNAVDSTIDLTNHPFVVNTDPFSNGGNINLDSDLTLANSSGSILNELGPNLHNYGGLIQSGQSTPTFFTVPDSLTPMNTGSIDRDHQSLDGDLQSDALGWGLLLLSISGLAIFAFWLRSTKSGPKCGYCRKPTSVKHKDARLTEFICLNCGKTFLLPSI
jgi:hypothetical protein